MLKEFHISAGLALGDAVCVTGAVRDLKTTFPESTIVVHDPFSDLWRGNPYVTYSARKSPEAGIKCRPPFAAHLVEEQRRYFERRWRIRMQRGPDVGDLHGQFGFRPFPSGYITIMAGGKYDCQAKWWPWWQQLVRQLHGWLPIVQLGSARDYHPVLDGTISLVGKTTIRQFVSVLAHTSLLISPVTAACHVIRATGNQAPMVTLGGGREPPEVVRYANQHYFSALGQMECCARPCWENRCSFFKDGFAECMRRISPECVANQVREMV